MERMYPGSTPTLTFRRAVYSLECKEKGWQHWNAGMEIERRGMDMNRAVDILHPLASLEWRECRRPPVSVAGSVHIGTQAVWLKDKVYVGGGGISGSLRDKARLYIYTPATDIWTTLKTPVYWFVLTTYHSQLVLVSGTECVDESLKGKPTNKLWTLSEDGQWRKTLPPLPLHHSGLVRLTSAVSHGDHLLVINEEYPKNKVYVYNGHHWARAQHPPQWLYSIKSTIVSGHYYLMGNEGLTIVPQKTCVYSVSLDSLLASCQPSETSQPSPLWKRLTDVPSEQCYPVVFGNRLVAIGERSSPTPTSLYAYSSFTQSWVHIGDAPVTPRGNPCAVVLPSNELMVVRRQTAFKAILKMTPFNLKGSYNERAIFLLEAAGIPVMTTLSDYTQTIKTFLGIACLTDINLNLNQLLKYWISDVQLVLPTWKNLLLIIRLLNLDELAQRMETYLSGAMEEPHEGPEVEMEEITREKESGKVKSQLRLQEETIYRLKQEMASLKEEKGAPIFTLEEKIKELESRVLIKKEDVEEKPVSLLPVKTEIKEELLTPEGELLAFPPAKTEFKEEAVTMTKAEATSAQPTTATWNLRGVEVCGAIAHKRVIKKQYRSKLFYLDHCNEIHFIVTWNTEAHLTVIEKEYIKRGAHPGPDQNVEFESDMISLDIPMEGISLKGWKITPLMRPVVTKEEVDNFLPGMGTPHCQLKVEFTGEGEKIPVLKDISLHGAKYPHNIFKIDLSTFCNTGTSINESQTSGELASATGPPPTKRQKLDDQDDTVKPEFKDLIKELYSTVSDRWEDIGILLEIEQGRLNAIKTAEKLPQSCLREMLKIWLNRVSPPPSWSAIVEAIKHLGDQCLADHLRNRVRVQMDVTMEAHPTDTSILRIDFCRILDL